MAELTRASVTGVNIASAAQVLSYDYDGAVPIEAVVRIDLGVDVGAAAGPIAGGGSYTVQLRIDDVAVLPQNVISVPGGTTKAIFVSRAVPLEPGDNVKLLVAGMAGDTAVNVVASLRDMTAVKQSDVLGVGAVEVDHDYGGTDALAYKTAGSVGIDNAEILVYLKSDYDAGNVGSQYVKGRTVTDVNGRWSRPLLLDPAAYTLVYSLQDRYGPTVVELTVT